MSDNYEAAVKKELGKEYPDVLPDVMRKLGFATPLAIWYNENSDDIEEFEKLMRRKVHYVIKPDYLWSNITELARSSTRDNELLLTLEKGFKYIENESFDSTFQGLFSEINLNRKSWVGATKSVIKGSVSSYKK